MNTADMSTSAQHCESNCLLLPAREVAKLLGISVRHVWALLAEGRLPRPLRLGRAVRWNVDELRAWLAAGGPEIAAWEWNRKGSDLAQSPLRASTCRPMPR
jgi:excisionase family DNA binding protein